MRRFLDHFRRRRLEREFSEELEHHRAELEAEHRAKGLTPEAARHAAQRDIGGALRAREQYREQGGILWLDALIRDVRFALRSLRRTPALTAAVIATLALGIGANTAIFSVVRTVQWKPLPYHEPERLMLFHTYEGPEELESFEAISQVAVSDVLMEDGDVSMMVPAVASSGRITDLFGVRLFAGRDFLDEEMARPRVFTVGGQSYTGAEVKERGVALISHKLLVEQYSADAANALGKTIRMWDRLHTITGVLPPDFRLPLPRANATQIEPDLIVNQWGQFQWIGRLRDGVAPQAATAELKVRNTGQGIPWGQSLHQFVTEASRRELMIVWFTVGCVLLIACVNVTNLLLVRSMSRIRETSVRAALGAGKWTLIRTVLVETALLSAAGGLAGLAIASGILRYISRLRGISLPRLPDVALNNDELLYAAACCGITALFAGLGPVVSVLRPSVLPVVRSGGEGTSSSSRGMRFFQGSLAATQVAIALLLLCGAGLLLKNLYQGRAAISDADPRHVLVGGVRTSVEQLKDRLNPRASLRKLEEDAAIQRELGSIPGVRSAALFMETIDIQMLEGLTIAIPGHARIDAKNLTRDTVSNLYFPASGHRLIAGRLFSDVDPPSPESRIDANTALVVNEAFVRTFAPGSAPQEVLWRQVTTTNRFSAVPRAAGTIIGVVNDLKLRPSGVAQPQLLMSRAQLGGAQPAIVNQVMVRSTGEPGELTARVAKILREHGLSIVDPQTLEDRALAAVATRDFETKLMASFAGVAVVLAMLGIYGVLNYAVSQRTREIGIRMALGADRGDVLSAVLRDGLWLVAVGMAVGLGSSFLLTRWMASVLTDVNAIDPWVMAAVCATLGAIAAAAAFFPARRATKVDPWRTLRHE